jgi:hypothetical protein
MAVPNSSPRASVGVSVRTPQMLSLVDGTFFPPDCCAIPWGRASGPAGLAPEALQERGCSCKVFSQSLPVCEVLVSAGIDNIPAVLGGAMRTCFTFVCVRCISKRCSHASSPRAWARSRRSGRALRHACTFPRRPFAGRRVRFPQLPSSGSQIADFSLSYYLVIQVDAHALFDKGWLVVRRLVHESAYVGSLGRARSRSLGTEGAEALPQWDPSTSYPRCLLNMTCGAPSSW